LPNLHSLTCDLQLHGHRAVLLQPSLLLLLQQVRRQLRLGVFRGLLQHLLASPADTLLTPT
jgi:hypothetical protein